MQLQDTIRATPQELGINGLMLRDDKGRDRAFYAGEQDVTPDTKTVSAQPTPEAVRKSQSDARVAQAQKAGLSKPTLQQLASRPTVQKYTRQRLEGLGLKHSLRVLNNSESPKPVTGHDVRNDNRGPKTALTPDTKKNVPVEKSMLEQALEKRAEHMPMPRPGRNPDWNKYLALKQTGSFAAKISRVVGAAFDIAERADPAAMLLSMAFDGGAALASQPAPQRARPRKLLEHNFG
jgi:hypothetical protein